MVFGRPHFAQQREMTLGLLQDPFEVEGDSPA